MKKGNLFYLIVLIVLTAIACNKDDQIDDSNGKKVEAVFEESNYNNVRFNDNKLTLKVPVVADKSLRDHTFLVFIKKDNEWKAINDPNADNSIRFWYSVIRDSDSNDNWLLAIERSIEKVQANDDNLDADFDLKTIFVANNVLQELFSKGVRMTNYEALYRGLKAYRD